MNDIEKPLVSVIVPVYKVEKYLRNCLDSLVGQTLSNWEAILVDDGSPDRCGEICDEYAAKDSRFKVIHKENGGLSSARNAALPIAKGTFIFFLDSDDYLHCKALKSLCVIATEYDVDIVQCNFIRGEESKFPEIVESGYSYYDNHSIFTSFAAKIITWGKLYRRNVIEDIRFPVGLINEDDFTTWKFYYRAKRIMVTDTPYYYYTVNSGSIMANQQRKPNLNYFNAYRERIDFFIKTGDADLEAISRIQWMKSLALLYSNNHLTGEERKEVQELFADNYQSKSLKAIEIPSKLSMVFRAFRLAPLTTSKLLKKLYRAGV